MSLESLVDEKSLRIHQYHDVTSRPSVGDRSEMDMDKRSAAARAVKKGLVEKIAADWEFQWPRVGSATSPATTIQYEETVEKAVEWRERSYATSDSSSVSEMETNNHTIGSIRERIRHTLGTDTWSRSDSLLSEASLEQRRQRRKKRRRKRLEEEMQWNDGLACFTARRNMWTCARPGAPVSNPSNEASMSSSDDSMMVNSNAPRTNGRFLSPTATEPSKSTSDTIPAAAAATDILVIPLCAPLIPPTNAIRTTIKPAIYPNLYSKIVEQGLTPSIPVNLSDIVRACVHGWQEAGEWPPKESVAPTTATGSVNGRRKVAARNSHPHIRKGVESVKKALRLSGSGSGSTVHIGEEAERVQV